MIHIVRLNFDGVKPPRQILKTIETRADATRHLLIESLGRYRDLPFGYNHRDDRCINHIIEGKSWSAT